MACGGNEYEPPPPPKVSVEQPEVREHYIKLVREVCTRYDMDGLELDFVRFWLYFRPGREHAGVNRLPRRRCDSWCASR